MSSIKTHKVRGCDGTQLHVREESRVGAAGLPFVLLDGIGCDGYVWKYIWEHFAAGHRIVHMHYRGHGLSAPPADLERLSIQDICDDLTCVLDDCGVERGILFGHSMGVQVALEYAGQHPERTAGVVPLTGAPGTPLDTFHDAGWMKVIFPHLLELVKELPGLVQSAWTLLVPTRLAWEIARRTEINGQMVRFEDFMPYLEHIGHIDVEVFFRMLDHASRHSAEEHLPEIEVPTLIVAGERDTFTPMWLSEKMNRLIPGSELLKLPAGSHTGPIEHPEFINLKLEGWLEEHFG